MPGSYIPDIDSRIWDLLEAGDVRQAREIHNAKLVLENNMRVIPYPQAAKEVLMRRGIISFAAARNTPPVALDAVDSAELDDALAHVARYLKC